MRYTENIFIPILTLSALLFSGVSNYAAPPTDITLTPASVNENLPVNTIVGTLTTTDPDAGDSFTYTLVTGSGDTDNGSFNILGDKLRTSAVFNYEVKSSYSIRVQTFDGTNIFSKALTVTITNVNDRPDLGNIEVSALSYTENDPAAIITSSITVADEDSPNLDSARVYFSQGYVSTEDNLSLVSGLFTISFATDSGILTLKNPTRTLIQYQTALRNVKYTNTNGANPSTADREVSFVVFNSGLRSDTLKRTIQITAVNDAPVLSGIEGSTLSYTENDAATPITNTILVTDGDDTNLESATVVISSGYQNGQDVLSFTNANGITGTWIAATGTMSLAGISSVANYQLALRNVRYANNSDNPSTVTRVISFTVNDGDVNSNTVSRNVSVTAVNDAPVLSAIETTTLSYMEGDPATIITSLIAVEDDDNPNLSSATVKINSGLVSTEDVLSLTGTGFTVNYTAATGILSVSGSGTLAAYQSALRNVKYQNTNAVNPSLATRTVTFTVNDGTAPSNTVSRDIVFTGINSPPVLSGIETSTLTYTENAAPIQITNTIQVADDDDTNLDSAKVVISSGYQNGEDTLTFTNAFGITGTWIPATGKMSLTGTSSLANYRTALRNVRYANNSDNPTLITRVISFTVNDGDANSNTLTRNLSVTAVNDAPVLSGIETSALPYTEGDTTTIITSSIVVKDTDNVNLSSATVRIISGLVPAEDVLSLTGTPFTVNYTASTGTLLILGLGTVSAYQSALRNVKYQNTNKDNPSLTTRTVTFTVNDGSLNSNTLSRNITITGVNDPPVASDAAITGPHTPFRTKELLTADYTYTDPENDPELGTTFKWFTAVNGSGAGRTLIAGADKDTLTPQFADGGKYISMVVIPRDNKGLWGDDDTSAWYYINAAPEMQNLTIVNRLRPGAIAVGETVSADYDYYDLESNPAGNHQFRWYRSSTGSWASATAISGATDSTYLIQSADNENYIAIEAFPHATVGSTPGERTRSAWFSVGTLPSAHISGSDTICSPGMDAELKVTLTGENPPWSFKYTVDGGNETEVTGVTQTTYTLHDTRVGTYVLTEVSDMKFENGNVSGTGRVLLYPATTASFTSENSCEAIQNTLSFALTGTSPWSLTYQYQSQSPVAVSGITQSPHTINVANTGTYTLLTVNDKKCVGTATGTHQIIPAPAVAIGEMETTYYFKSDSVTVNVSPPGGNFNESDSPLAFILFGEQWRFYPSIAYAVFGSPFKIRYAYQDPGTSCVGKDSLRVFIIEKPVDIQIENEKSIYCFNDDTLLVFGVNIRNNNGHFSISNNTGLIDMGDSAYVIPSVIKEGYRTLYYTVDIDGTPETATKLLFFGNIDGDFTWDNECWDDNAIVNFSDNSESEQEFVDYLWNFYLPDDTITRTSPETTINFSELRTYDIDLIVTTQYNEDFCYDTIRKQLSLKPTYTIHDMPYDQDFSNGVGYWSTFSIDEEGQNSWNFGKPVGGVFDNIPAGENAWYTNIQDPETIENSYVISPCFDFTNALRPMVKMDLWRAFYIIYDGAVLQYTLDNGISWTNVGTTHDGIAWYNAFNILGSPGGQPIGWTRLEGENVDSNWVEARHKLDELKGKTNVRFRMAYGSPAGNNYARNGIAFDDFRIGERTKKVLFEHFTNAGDPDCVPADNQFNTFMNSPLNQSDIIDIQYHMRFPGPDTFYTLNTGPPFSRGEYYYGISSVPYGIIDGGRGGNPTCLIDYSVEGLEGLTQNNLTIAALEDNKFNIDMQVFKGNNSLGIDIEIEANEAISQRYITLHVAIIENIITGITGGNGETQFESVLKAMLPNVSGTLFNKSWAQGEIVRESFDYIYQDVFNELELRVVAFVQDEESKTIYQAEIINPNIVNGIDPNDGANRNNFTLFPNPASSVVFVKLNEYTANDLKLELFNSEGRVIYMRKIMQGEEIVSIPLNSIDAGLYFIRLTGNEVILGTEKLIHLGNK